MESCIGNYEYYNVTLDSNSKTNEVIYAIYIIRFKWILWHNLRIKFPN